MDEAGAWRHLEILRWDGAAERCPHCGERGACTFLPTRSGGPRTTSSGWPTVRRVWRCAACRQQFTVLTGTLLERTRVPLSVWLAIASAASASSVSARGLARAHGITPETVRLLLARLGAGGSGGSGDAVLRRVLRLPPDEVARIRAATPARWSRPGPGPSADYH